MPFNYSDAPPPRDFELIPDDTIATIVMHIRPGGAGEDSILKRSAKGDCEMLDIECVLADGLYKGRKFWEYLIVEGGTTDGHAKAIEISRSRLKAILDSALGLDPNDKSDKAQAARTVSYKDFEGMTFIGKVGVEKGGPKKDSPGENWPDKNILAGVITPDKKDWHPVEQPPPFNGGGAGAQAAAPASTAAPSRGRGGRHEQEGPPRRRGLDLRNRRPMATRRHRRRHYSHAWGRPDGRPRSAGHADRPAERYRMGLDLLQCAIRLDR
jgi:hypothetical protein